MEWKYTLASLLCAGLAVSLSVAASVNVSKDQEKTELGNKVLVCYVSSWARNRFGNGSFAIDDIDPQLCTHLVYAFAVLNATSFTLSSRDPKDLEDDGKVSYNRLSGFRDKHPSVKVTLAVGGWDDGSANYSRMASSAENRKRFVTSAVDFVGRFNFDGLDLVWMYPGQQSRGGKPEDKNNFLSLVKELRSAFAPHNWLLTAALGSGQETIEAAYHVAELSEQLDFLHVMCYDYHGLWENYTNANTPLHKQFDKFSVEDTIELLLSKGAAPSKLVLGLAAYGHAFTTVAPDTSTLRALAVKPGFQGPYTRENGYLSYNEICLDVEMCNTKSSSEWVKLWDNDTDTPFAVKGNKVISYDNELSIGKKVKFAMSKQLAGLMVWAIDNDDFHGDCGCGRFPLLRSIHKAVATATGNSTSDIGANIAAQWLMVAALYLASHVR